ncbi:hypothetical protein, partial [Burkholderia mallei]|uniref:hypothetical protein n=1 Tax=Burkholderia mallei TaxID=13373 RepID=UPI001601C254
LWPSIFLSDEHGDHIHVLRDRGLLFVTRFVGAPQREAALLSARPHRAAGRGRARDLPHNRAQPILLDSAKFPLPTD